MTYQEKYDAMIQGLRDELAELEKRTDLTEDDQEYWDREHLRQTIELPHLPPLPDEVLPTPGIPINVIAFQFDEELGRVRNVYGFHDELSGQDFLFTEEEMQEVALSMWTMGKKLEVPV